MSNSSYMLAPTLPANTHGEIEFGFLCNYSKVFQKISIYPLCTYTAITHLVRPHLFEALFKIVHVLSMIPHFALVSTTFCAYVAIMAFHEMNPL